MYDFLLSFDIMMMMMVN